MNAQIAPDRLAIVRSASEIRSAWTTEERQKRAAVARRYSRMLLQLVNEPEECEDVWAVGAPTNFDLGLLAATS